MTYEEAIREATVNAEQAAAKSDTHVSLVKATVANAFATIALAIATREATVEVTDAEATPTLVRNVRSRTGYAESGASVGVRGDE